LIKFYEKVEEKMKYELKAERLPDRMESPA
jgi:hypothetical protein